MSLTHYNWLVDRQPTQNRYTVVGDVTGSIEVSMEFKTAVTTQVLGPITITFVNMATNRAFLRGIPSIDRDNLLTKILRFIPNKLFQFKERPVVQFPVELGTTSFLNADLGQVFECECGEIRVDNLLRDTVINISHKPSFPTGHFTEFPFSRSGAF